MQRLYLIYIDGRLAERKLTNPGAKKRVRELRELGYKNVTYAYDIDILNVIKLEDK